MEIAETLQIRQKDILNKHLQPPEVLVSIIVVYVPFFTLIAKLLSAANKTNIEVKALSTDVVVAIVEDNIPSAGCMIGV